MTVRRMDKIGSVVEDLDAAVEFFTELGLELEGSGYGVVISACWGACASGFGGYYAAGQGDVPVIIRVTGVGFFDT